MSSFIQPVRPIDTAPPWDWNPGATYVTAFNETRLAQQKAEEMAMANQLESILLPYKQKQAALALDKLQFDIELQSERLDQEREAFSEMRKQGFGATKNVNNFSRFSPSAIFGTTNKVTTAATPNTPSAAPANRVIGSGVTPKTP